MCSHAYCKDEAFVPVLSLELIPLPRANLDISADAPQKLLDIMEDPSIEKQTFGGVCKSVFLPS